MKFECYEFFDEIGIKSGWMCGVAGHVTIEAFNKRFDCDAVKMVRFNPTVGELFPEVKEQ